MAELVDITQLLLDASADMQDSEILFMPNYTLNDAMSAFEIGEPRLDSGMPPPGSSNDADASLKAFVPAESLLPEELCWLIDKAFAYEMAFHKGHYLAHTIYNLLHVHFLDWINPDSVHLSSLPKDPGKPLELVTIVLRAFFFGLLKTTEHTWRELNKFAVFDAEDWQADKCEVSLLESTPVAFIERLLDDAINWVITSGKVSEEWVPAISARLVLRKVLLQFVTTNTQRNGSQYTHWIESARSHIDTIRRQTPKSDHDPNDNDNAPVRKAIQPIVARGLSTFTPFVTVQPMSPDETWTFIERLLVGWSEIYKLSRTHCFSTWNIVGSLRLFRGELPTDTPLMRSLTQTTFYDNVLILNTHSFSWLTDRFFFETVGLSWAELTRRVNANLSEFDHGHSTSEVNIYMKQVEKICAQLFRTHIRSLYLNPPRRRRHFQKSIIEWHSLAESLDDVVKFIDNQKIQHSSLLLNIALPAHIYRLRCILFEIVLSGFPLELYNWEEKCYAYWYVWKAGGVLESLISADGGTVPGILGYLKDIDVNGDRKANSDLDKVRKEWEFEQRFVSAVRKMAEGCFKLLAPRICPIDDLTGMRSRFMRRHKWAFVVEYGDFVNPPICQPQFWAWVKDVEDIGSKRHSYESARVDILEAFDHALLCLDQTLEEKGETGWAGDWSWKRRQFIESLRRTCASFSIGIGQGWPSSEHWSDWGRLDWGTVSASGTIRDDGAWFPKIRETSC